MTPPAVGSAPPGAPSSAPSGGVVTLLFTDLVGSTELLGRLGDDRAEELRRAHFSLLRQAIAETAGREVKNLGDGLMVVFDSPVEALHCAVGMQQVVEDHNTRQPDLGLRIRVGLHVGDPPREEGDFFGTAVVVARRLCDAAEGGEILISELLAGLVGSRGGFRFRPAGSKALKGLPRPLPALVVDWRRAQPGGPGDAPPPPAASRPRRPARPRGPRLVGREGELAALEAELDRAGAGEFRCVLLLGEPGIGKTRLVAELLSRQAERVLALTARAYPLGDTASFGLWSEALERHLRDLPGKEVGELCGGFLDDLAGLLRSVAALLGAAPDREPPRFRLLEGLALLMANLARQRPLVIFLDDVHLADASSWDGLHYLARNLSDAPVLVIAAARPTELVEHQLGNQVLLGLEQEGLLRRLQAHPLGREAVHELAEAILGHQPPPALVDWLADRSRGNALFAIGLLRALLEEGADLSAPKLRSLPEELALRVGSRLERLDEEHRETLEILAVLAGRAELDDLLTLTGRPLEELETILEALVRFRLVVDEERGWELTYEIAHPLIQESIYQGIGTARRRRLHRTVGRVLLTAGRLGAAAPHFACSAMPGDLEAIETLRDALRQAEDRGAYREASTILGALVELLPANDPRWLEVAEAMSWQSAWVVENRAGVHGSLGLQALRAIDRALEGSAEPVRRAAVKLRTSSLLARGTGELDAALVIGGQALELFEESHDVAGTLLATNELGFIRGMQGDLAAMETEALRVVERAEAAGERFVDMRASYSVGLAAIFRGRFDVAEAVLGRSIALAEEDGDLWQWSRALAMHALGLALGGDVHRALLVLEEAKAVNPGFRDVLDVPVLEWEMVVLWLAGSFPAALDIAREAVAWNPGGFSRRRAFGMAFAALAAAERGQLAEACQHLARAEGAYGGRRFFVFTECCSYARGILAWRGGDHLTALKELRTATSSLLGMEARPLAALVLVEWAEVAVEAGDVEAAWEAVSRLDEVAGALDRPLPRALAGIARAGASLASGEADRAAAAAGAAATSLSGSGYEAFFGRALETLGRALAPADPAGATDAFERAVAAFDACGATWRRERARRWFERVLAGSEADRESRPGVDAGERPPARASLPGGLTEREAGVLRLVASGQTNRQIAAELFLSEKTVARHLSNIFTKTGVSSRAAATAFAFREKIV